MPEKIENTQQPANHQASCYLAVGEDHYTGLVLNSNEAGPFTGTLRDYIQNYEAGRYDIRKLSLSAKGMTGQQMVTLTEGTGEPFEQEWNFKTDRIYFTRLGWAFGGAKPHDCQEMEALFDKLEKETFTPADPSELNGQVPG